jgi:hypothetical protein
MIDHALFGYAEGHRQLAATVRLPSQDMYHLTAASDLASDVRLDAAKSYLTGLPLVESQKYALIRTWPAPEMPRPGCVWSHVLLLDEGILSAQRDVSEFFTFFRNPKNVNRSFYSEPLSLLEGDSQVSPPMRSLQVSEIISRYYSDQPTFLRSGAGADALEAAIAAVWSQKWPRLRMEFSFRTAELGSHRRRSRYDVQVTSFDIPEEAVDSEWVAAASADAAGGRVTPLRRFLWRYGRDIKDSRRRFRLLVETYLASGAGERLPMAAAERVFAELRGEEDGNILKQDIWGFDTTSLSICPAVSFLDMLRLIDRHGSDDTVDVEEIRRRFEKLPSAEIAEVVVFASAEGNRLHRLSETIFDWTVRCADDELVDTEMPSGLRTRILIARPDLITTRAVSSLHSDDVFRLFSDCAATEARRIILDVAVRRDVGEATGTFLNQATATVAVSVIRAARGGELHPSWLNPILKSRDPLLASALLQHLESFSDLMITARLMNLSRSVSSLGRSSANWASRWRGLQRDLPESEILDIEADLFSFALIEASPGSWDLIAAVLPELRGTVIRGLEGDAYQKLDHALPGIGYDNWDLNRRILLALHRLQKGTLVSRQTLFAAGLSTPETDFVLVGPKEEQKRNLGLFWWLS